MKIKSDSEPKKHKDFVSNFNRTCYYKTYKNGVLLSSGPCIAKSRMTSRDTEEIQTYTTTNYKTIILRKVNDLRQ